MCSLFIHTCNFYVQIFNIQDSFLFQPVETVNTPVPVPIASFTHSRDKEIIIDESNEKSASPLVETDISAPSAIQTVVIDGTIPSAAEFLIQASQTSLQGTVQYNILFSVRMMYRKMLWLLVALVISAEYNLLPVTLIFVVFSFPCKCFLMQIKGQLLQQIRITNIIYCRK